MPAPMGVQTDQRVRPHWEVVIVSAFESDSPEGLASVGLYTDAMLTKTGCMMRRMMDKEQLVISSIGQIYQPTWIGLVCVL